jgi:cytochrome oxidase Cu insertion factor (SCO1/SenC/PrrC family)
MMGRHSRSAAVVGALLVLATGLLAGCGGSTSSTATTAKLAPDFTGVTLDGAEVSLSEYRGKPLVLAFMASW